MADSPRTGESSPIYHDVPPVASIATKVVGIFTVVMVVISFIICMVKGTSNHTFYLLACNLIISTVIAVVTGWWYKNGDLQPDKYWYVIMVGVVILFQCLTTDIYVLSMKHMSDITTTAAPSTTKLIVEITPPAIAI